VVLSSHDPLRSVQLAPITLTMAGGRIVTS
jgi:hypothetical protein